jgi:hypothetical protein
MKNLSIYAFALSCIATIGFATDPVLAQNMDHWQLIKMSYTTPAYQKAATSALLKEIDTINDELQLANKPLQESDVTEIYIQSPFMAKNSGMFGYIITHKFAYFASQGDKLCYITRVFGKGDEGGQQDMDSLKAKYLLPKSEMNTNGAYDLAVQWLKKMSVDVDALNRDSKAQVTAWIVGDKFVPLYRVEWVQPFATQNASADPNITSQTIASVVLFEPDKSLRELRVEESQYQNHLLTRNDSTGPLDFTWGYCWSSRNTI